MAEFFERLEDAPPINQPLALGSVCAVFLKDHVLLERRSDNGQWSFLGGKADDGETPLECAARELEEETGLIGLDLKFVKLFDNPGSIGAYDDGNVVQTHFSLFTAQLDHEPQLRISEESLELRFVSISELHKLSIVASHNPILRWIEEYTLETKRMTPELNIQFEENDQRGRFFADLGDGQQAEMTFIRHGDIMVVDHTGVPKPFEGRGIAAKLVVAGVEFAREIGRKIRPVCPYVVVQFKRHKEWADVLAA
ncbi:N-acetyltransferase [Maritalea sp.]|jgi:8-oxo-dGTP pyrophosphatase MutT (NUDIX family)/predicted GNAT family acetyltransferase|uniref:N-acetyltransferase n=1 Tax=Maritalea sp. TaxID=2003361 RepID=UPI0039E52663